MTQDKREKEKALEEHAAAREGVYVVQPGDHLSKIAKEVYGDARRWPEIFEANKDKISDPNLIYPGQELRIPYGPEDAVEEAEFPPTEALTEPLPPEPPTELPPAGPPTELPPVETPTEPLPTEPPTELPPIETPTEPLPAEPPTELPPIETPLEPLPAEPPTELPPIEPPVEEAPPAEMPTEPSPQPTVAPPAEPPPQPTGEIIGESYGDFPVNSAPTDPPAEEHPDLNLTMLGYEPTDAYKGLVDYGGATDPNAPQLPSLFADNRTPTFSAVYQIYRWDWERNRLGALITSPEVTLVGMAVTPGETIHVPSSGYTIGGGYAVLVLYATPERITLKYTPDDHVVWGYTLHVENIYVEPRLLALYQSWNEAGRDRLPALRSGQAFGRARGSEVGVAIRDTGSIMDPRSRKDWWRGR